MTEKEQDQLNEKLIYFSEYGILEDIKKVISQGADVHAQNDSALRYSSYEGHLEKVRFLVEQGANIHAEDNEALIVAAENGYLEIVKYFVLEHNLDAKLVLGIAKESKEYEVFEWCKKYIDSQELNNKLESHLSSKFDKINSKKMKV